MPQEIKLPELGENVPAGDVVSVLVSVDDTIEVDQSVLEIETDKAVIEVPSTVAGVVREVRVQAGQKAKVGQVILVVDPTNMSAAKTPAESQPQPESQGQQESQSQTTATEPPVAALSAPPPAPTQPPAIQVLPSRSGPGQSAPAAPSVRRFARELGLDIHVIPGSGSSGRISKEDVKNYSRQINTQGPRAGSVACVHPVALPDFSKWGEIDRQPMNKVRRVTAEHLHQAWVSIPHVTQFDKADITKLDGLRKRCADPVEAAGGKLTVTAILLKILASALKVFPQFNATVDLPQKEIIYKKFYNIGVAVDTERGLLVPVVRDVDKKNIRDIAVELSDLAEKTRNRKASPDDLQGGTFTVSNLGGIGGTAFTPIVNSPEVAILGISRSAVEPVYCDGEFAPRLMLPLSLSYDHRLIDGADGARFLRWVVKALEEPFVISLEG